MHSIHPLPLVVVLMQRIKIFNYRSLTFTLTISLSHDTNPIFLPSFLILDQHILYMKSLFQGFLSI